jgi:methionine aminopeptidase
MGNDLADYNNDGYIDIVSLDMGLVHKGLFTDSAITVGVGNVDEAGKRLIENTKNEQNRT